MQYKISENYNELVKSVSCETKMELIFTEEELHKFKYSDESEKVLEIQKFIHEKAVEQFKLARQTSQNETMKKM